MALQRLLHLTARAVIQSTQRQCMTVPSTSSASALRTQLLLRCQQALQVAARNAPRATIALIGATVLRQPLLRLPFVQVVQCKKRIRTHENRVVAEVPLRVRDLWWLLRPFVHWFIAAIAAAVVVAYINIKLPLLLGDLVNIIADINAGVRGVDTQLYQLAANVALQHTLQALFTFAYISCLSVLGERMAMRLRQTLFNSLISQEIAFFDMHRTGELSARLNTDVQEFKSAFKMCVAQGLRTITQIGGSVISLYFISAKMTLVTVGVLPMIILIGTAFGSLLRIQSRYAQMASAKAATHADESLANIRTVRAFAAEDERSEAFHNDLDASRAMHERLGLGIGIFQAGANLALNGIVLGVIYGGSKLIAGGDMQLGDLTSFLVTAQTIQRSMAQLSILFGQAVRGYTAGARVFEYINHLPQHSLKGGRRVPFHSLVGDVTFDQVNFAYPTRPDAPVLRECSLHVPNGTVLALVGQSGAGKSTIVSLLERFYDVSSGRILIDKHDIRTLDQSWLRTQVLAFISQEPVLFDTSIRENIRFGKQNATDEEIIAAAKAANAHSFIEAFPNGYDTIVGERGAALSGGQRQRVAIARALLRDAPILILDEATSALDAESEQQVHAALDNASRGRTVIVIAHRLSTVRNADKIAVIDGGRVVEIGTHTELMKKKGVYYKLVNLQSSAELDDWLK